MENTATTENGHYELFPMRDTFTSYLRGAMVHGRFTLLGLRPIHAHREDDGTPKAERESHLPFAFDCTPGDFKLGQ